MADVNVGDKYKIINYCTYEDQTSLNVSYVNIQAVTGGTVDDSVLFPLLSSTLGALFAPLLTGNATYYGMAWQLQLPSLGAIFYTAAGRAAGTAGTQAMAGQLCGYFNMKGKDGGRNQIGRKYIPFPDTADNSTLDSYPSTGYMTRLGALASKFQGNYNIVSGLVTVRFQPQIFSPTAANYYNSIVCTSKQKWATQRRRGKFGRPNAPPF